jgi:hypothetical protein
VKRRGSEQKKKKHRKKRKRKRHVEIKDEKSWKKSGCLTP